MAMRRSCKEMGVAKSGRTEGLRGNAMLDDLIKQVAHCYWRAAECNERAASCVSLDDKALYIDRETAWLTLARSFEFSERIGRVLDERQMRTLRNWPAAGRMPPFKVVS